MCGIIQVSRQWKHLAALGQHQPKQACGGLSGAVVVHTDERKTPAARCIRVECDDRNALFVQFINALANLRRVIRRDSQSLHAL